MCAQCIHSGNSIQGILSESVCWGVLEEQLLHSKQGRNERLHNIFKIAAERQINGRYGDPIQSCDQNSGSLFPSHPTILPIQPRIFKSEAHKETVSLMLAVLNSSTHFSNFAQPVEPELASFVAAKDDLYIPRHNVSDVRTLWPGLSRSYLPINNVLIFFS